MNKVEKLLQELTELQYPSAIKSCVDNLVKIKEKKDLMDKDYNLSKKVFLELLENKSGTYEGTHKNLIVNNIEERTSVDYKALSEFLITKYNISNQTISRFNKTTQGYTSLKVSEKNYK